jgi:hypothetical protein
MLSYQVVHRVDFSLHDCSISFLLYNLETEYCVKHFVLWDRNETVLLQCGLYYLTFHIEGPKNVTTFWGLLIEHQYP